jgi:hypothetical protein
MQGLKEYEDKLYERYEMERFYNSCKGIETIPFCNWRIMEEMKIIIEPEILEPEYIEEPTLSQGPFIKTDVNHNLIKKSSECKQLMKKPLTMVIKKKLIQKL